MRWRDHAGLYLGFLLPVWKLIPLFGMDGVPRSWDAAGHLLRASYWIRQVVPSGHLTGFFPNWGGGMDLYHTTPPLLTWLLAPFIVTLGEALTLRLALVLCWLAIVPASYVFLRAFRFSAYAAATGALVSLLVDSAFSLGPYATLYYGFLPQSLGFALAILFLGLLWSFLRAPTASWRSYTFAVLSGAAVAWCHPVAAAWAAALAHVFWLVVVFIDESWSAFKRGLAVLAAVVLLAAPWWLPFLYLNALMSHHPSLSNPSGLWRFFIPFQQSLIMTAFLAVAAAGLAAWRATSDRSERVAFVSAAALTVLLSSGFARFLPFIAPALAASHENRLDGLVFWLLVPCVAAAAAWVERHPGANGYVRRAAFLGAAAAAVFVRMGWVGVWSQPLRTPETDQLPGLISYLHDNARPGETMLSENESAAVLSIASPHFFNQWIPLTAPDVWVADNNYPEAAVGAAVMHYTARTLKTTNFAKTIPYLRRRGVRFIATVTEKVRLRMEKQPDILPLPLPQATANEIALFELRDFDTPFGLPPEAGRKLVSVGFSPPGRYEVRFSTPVALPPGASVAVNYHPWLRVQLDGAAVAAGANEDGSLSVVEGGAAVTSMIIRFSPPAWVGRLYVLGFILLMLFVFSFSPVPAARLARERLMAALS